MFLIFINYVLMFILLKSVSQKGVLCKIFHLQKCHFVSKNPQISDIMSTINKQIKDTEIQAATLKAACPVTKDYTTNTY